MAKKLPANVGSMKIPNRMKPAVGMSCVPAKFLQELLLPQPRRAPKAIIRHGMPVLTRTAVTKYSTESFPRYPNKFGPGISNPSKRRCELFAGRIQPEFTRGLAERPVQRGNGLNCPFNGASMWDRLSVWKAWCVRAPAGAQQERIWCIIS